MIYIGPHIKSNLKKLFLFPKIAYNLKATTFSFGLHTLNKYNFIKKNIKNFLKNIKIYNFNKKYIIPHASFYINLAEFNKFKLKKSIYRLYKEIYFLKKIKINKINLHIGYHLNKNSVNKCLDRIIYSINLIINKFNNFKIIIENSARQGTSLGYNIIHLINIIKNINNKKFIGLCLDTCHLFSAGYKINKDWNKLLFFLDKKIGLNYLNLIHLNDTKNLFNSFKDKHENLMKGKIEKNFYKIFKKNIKKIYNIPIILETYNPFFWKKEINWVKNC